MTRPTNSLEQLKTRVDESYRSQPVSKVLLFDGTTPTDGMAPPWIEPHIRVQDILGFESLERYVSIIDLGKGLCHKHHRDNTGGCVVRSKDSNWTHARFYGYNPGYVAPERHSNLYLGDTTLPAFQSDFFSVGVSMERFLNNGESVAMGINIDSLTAKLLYLHGIESTGSRLVTFTKTYHAHGNEGDTTSARDILLRCAKPSWQESHNTVEDMGHRAFNGPALGTGLLADILRLNPKCRPTDQTLMQHPFMHMQL